MKAIVFFLKKRSRRHIFLPKALQIPCATAGSTWATSKVAVAAGTEGQVFPWHPFHHTDSCGKPVPSGQQPLLSQLHARMVGPGQQAGAPFFSQSPTIPGSAPCRCRKGERLQCVKGREEEKRRCKCACMCVCVLGGDGDVG